SFPPQTVHSKRSQSWDFQSAPLHRPSGPQNIRRNPSVGREPLPARLTVEVLAFPVNDGLMLPGGCHHLIEDVGHTLAHRVGLALEIDGAIEHSPIGVRREVKEDLDHLLLGAVRTPLLELKLLEQLGFRSLDSLLVDLGFSLRLELSAALIGNDR